MLRVVVDRHFVGMVRTGLLDLVRGDVCVALTEEMQVRASWRTQLVGDAPVETDSRLHVEAACRRKIREHPAHTETSDTDRRGAGLLHIGDALANVVERLVDLHRAVPTFGHCLVDVTATEMMEEVRRDSRIPLMGQALAHAQQLLRHAVALHYHDDGRMAGGADRRLREEERGGCGTGHGEPPGTRRSRAPRSKHKAVHSRSTATHDSSRDERRIASSTACPATPSANVAASGSVATGLPRMRSRRTANNCVYGERSKPVECHMSYVVCSSSAGGGIGALLRRSAGVSSWRGPAPVSTQTSSPCNHALPPVPVILVAARNCPPTAHELCMIPSRPVVSRNCTVYVSSAVIARGASVWTVALTRSNSPRVT